MKANAEKQVARVQDQQPTKPDPVDGPSLIRRVKFPSLFAEFMRVGGDMRPTTSVLWSAKGLRTTRCMLVGAMAVGYSCTADSSPDVLEPDSLDNASMEVPQADYGHVLMDDGASDGTLVDVWSFDHDPHDLAPWESGAPPDADSPANDTVDVLTRHDNVDPGDWCPDTYTYVAQTPIIAVVPYLLDFTSADLVSGIGALVPSILLQMWHILPYELDTLALEIGTSYQLTRLSDGATLSLKATPTRLPRYQNGACFSPTMVRYSITLEPDAKLDPNEWYEVGLGPVSNKVRPYLEPTQHGRFRQGHDPRIGMIHRDHDGGSLSHGFTEVQHSPSLTDAPTVIVSQGTEPSLACGIGTPSNAWLGNGERGIYIQYCNGLDVAEPFVITIGGVLATVDGITLQNQDGKYILAVQPDLWDLGFVNYVPQLP